MKKFIYIFIIHALLIHAAWASEGSHVITASGDEEFTYTSPTVLKTDDISGQNDDYDWKGTNAAVWAGNKAQLTITGGTIDSTASYGNAVFSYGGNLNGSNSGDGTKIIISDTSITTTKNNSGGIMVTGGGEIEATNLTVSTSGQSSAAIRSDKGGGTITANGGTYTSSGAGSPAIYSTANITVIDADLTSDAAQGIVIEGGNSVTLTNTKLNANNTTLNGKSTTYQAVMLYQSQSGDAKDGASTFNMTGGSITNAKGDIFYVTNTTSNINLNGVTITNNDSSGAFLTAAAGPWGRSGSNGGTVILNASGQTITGDMNIDSVSSLILTLKDDSKLTGAINNNNKSTSVIVKIEEGSTWTLTGDSYITSLTNNGTINTGNYTLYVNGTAYNSITLSPESLDAVAVGSTVSKTITATPVTGDASGAIWDFTDNTLSDYGLTITGSGGTATISGTASKIGTATIPVNVTIGSFTRSAVYSLDITGTAPVITLSGDSQSSGDITSLFTDSTGSAGGSIVAGSSLVSSDGNYPFSFMVSGSVEGLSFDAVVTHGTDTIDTITFTQNDIITSDGSTGSAGYTGYRTGYLSGTFPSVTSDTVYTITITATNAQDTVTTTYTFTVSPAPALTASAAAFTWGTESTFTPTASNTDNVTWSIASVNAAGETLSSDEYFLTAEDMSALTGLSFDTSSGKISGTWNVVSSDFDLGSADKITRKVRLIVEKSGVYDSADITITFNGTKPELTAVASVEAWSKALEWDVELKSTDTIIEASAPGSIDWTVGTLPNGISYDISADRTKEAKSTLIFYGTPTLTGSVTVSIKAANGVGNSSIGPKFTVTATELIETESCDPLPSGDYGVGDFISQDAYTTSGDRGTSTRHLYVYPGPITWTSTNLPTGITLSWDKKGDGTHAELIGKFTKAQSAKTYTLTATNSTNTKKLTKTFTGSIRVYAAPEISTTSFKALTVDSAYSSSVLTAKNDPLTWDVTFSGDNKGFTHGFTAGLGSSYISFDEKSKKITGSLDRMPLNGIITVRIQASNPSGTGSKDVTIKVKSVAPTVTTKTIKDMTGSAGGSATIQTSGTKPITMKAYIDVAAAKKFFDVKDGSSIDLKVASGSAIPTAKTASNPTGFYFVPDMDSTGTEELGTGTLTLIPGQKVAYKALPITFTAANDNNKPASKTLKVNVAGADPFWCVYSDDEYAAIAKDTKEYVINAVSSVDLGTSYKFVTSGDAPVTVTPSQKFGATNAKNGIYIIESDDDTYGKVYTIMGVPTPQKETKTSITLTAANPSTGKKSVVKVTVSAKQPPYITSKQKALEQEVLFGKKVNLKLSAKGSKTITWQILDDYADGATAAASLSDYGLTFNGKDGIITGTTKKITTDTSDTYKSLDIYVAAVNSVGITNSSPDNPPAHVRIGVMGAAPKLQTKTLTFYKDNLNLSSGDALLKTTQTGDNANVTYELTFKNNAEKQKFTDLGFNTSIARNSENRNYGQFSLSGDLQATKGTSIKLVATNYGTTANGSAKVTVYDRKPVINTPSYTASYTVSKDKATTYDIALSLTDVTQPTGDSKITWKITGKPDKPATAKLEVDKKATGNAKLKLTIGKSNITEKVETSITVRATTSSIKDKTSNYGEVTLTFTINPAAADNKDLPEQKDVKMTPESEPPAEPDQPAEPELEPEPVLQGIVTFGSARSLSAAQSARLAESGYEVAAILPAMSADVSGQYDIDATLSENAAIGAELVYLAFPVDGVTTEDDEIVDFYDTDGEYIERVPENRQVIVSPWLTAGKVYEPVIAVKVER